MSTNETAVDTLNERFIPDLKMDIIQYDPNNPRKHMDKDKLNELAASIQQHGLVEPIVVRPHPKLKTQYMIVAGERRHRASVIAKKDSIPSIIRHYTDQQAAEVQQIENLQRADIHPLDEAHGFTRLIAEFKYTAASIAEKIGKPTGYVVRRMALVRLLKKLQDAMWKEKLPLAHAEYICRFSEYDQTLLERVMWQPYNDNQAAPLRSLKAEADRIIFSNLDRAPWKQDDDFVSGLPICKACPYRSGCSPSLFPEFEKQPNTCTNRECFDTKMDAYIDHQLIGNPKWLLVSDEWQQAKKEAGVYVRGSYHAIENKADKCEHQQAAIFKDGPRAGHSGQVCIAKDCKKHASQIYNKGRADQKYLDESAKKASEQRIESSARQAVFGALWEVDSKKIKLDKDCLQVIARSVYDRAYDRDRAAKAFGFTRTKSQYSASYLPQVEAWLDKASERSLMKFIVLLVNAGFLSTYGGKGESKKALKEATAGWGVDIDLVHSSCRKGLEAKSKKKAVKKAVKK